MWGWLTNDGLLEAYERERDEWSARYHRVNNRLEEAILEGNSEAAEKWAFVLNVILAEKPWPPV